MEWHGWRGEERRGEVRRGGAGQGGVRSRVEWILSGEERSGVE